ncbi:uncharacterized protein ACRADG_012990 [Cochliomyia hominivorax]
MAITANKKFWADFIDIYHSLPSLWNTKDENYNNRESRSFAWNKLVEKLREVEPDANQDSVKRKINTFRSNFNREVRKIRQTQKDQPSEIYNPTLWYFDHLSFLLYQDKCSASNVSVDGHSYDDELTLMGLSHTKPEIMDENDTLTAESINQDEMTLTDHEQNSSYEKALINKTSSRLGPKRGRNDIKPLAAYSPPSSEVATPELSPVKVQTTSIDPNPSTLINSHKDFAENETKCLESDKTNLKSLRSSSNKRSRWRLKSQDPYNRTVIRNGTFSSILNDEAAIYGQSWACGFRKLTPQQKLFAKKAIDEILILGQLKALKFQTITMNANLMDEAGSEEG